MITGIGETILDILFRNEQPQGAVPGGSAFNAIISLGKMGVDCNFITEIGDDYVGDIIMKYLMAHGVDTSYVNRNKGTKSHLSLAFLDENNDAQYLFYKDHAHACIADRMPSFTENDKVVFGSYFAINPKIRNQVLQMLSAAHDEGALLYYDLNFRASHIAEIPMLMDNIEENMRLSTIVRGSLEDFEHLYGISDVDAIYEKHIREHCPMFICTNGSKPIELRTPKLRMSFETRKIETISTVGAGDNFNAGFLYGTVMNNIKPRDIHVMPENMWQQLVQCGQEFSADVCASIFNSVSDDFIRNFKIQNLS